MFNIRNYRQDDYEDLKALYLQGDLYGGQFDEARDSQEKLHHATNLDPQSIIVCEEEGKIIGTISLIENRRAAWLFRFAVQPENKNAAQALYECACEILKSRGHQQVLIYSPEGNADLDQRYADLKMNKGNVYTCYWHTL